MKKEFSIYLDLVRFGAAALVLLFHINVRYISTKILPFSSHGHSAVIVFFILSGYVIAYISSGRENTPVEYWSSRLSRFYSLAVPAVLLSPLLDLAGESMQPDFYSGGTTHDWWALRILSSLLFTNELWAVSITSFSNVPYWSLCYEMWYYVLFAISIFSTGKRRVALFLGAALFIGPKILILAPIWAIGVVLFRWQRLMQLKSWQYWALFLTSIPGYWLYDYYQLDAVGSRWLLALVGPVVHKNAVYSRHFLTDYPLALCIAANFVGFRGIAHHFSRPLLAMERPIRWVASFTFSLYLLHQPFLQFYAALIQGDPAQPWFMLEVLGATLGSIFVISLLTERKRSTLRKAIKQGLLRLSEVKWVQRALARPVGAS